MSEKFTREDLLRHLRHPESHPEPQDELDRKALEGYAYLGSDQDAEQILDRLDQRFGSVSRVQSVQAVRRFQLRTWHKVAASIVLLLIPAYFLLRSPSDEALFHTYFEAPRSTYFQTTRSVDATVDDDLSQAFAHYERGEWDVLLEALPQLQDQYPEKQDLTFYEGVAALAAGHTDDAIRLLRQCTNVTYQGVDRQAPWFLALAYLRRGDRAEAISWLEKTAELDSPRRDDASELLERLR